MATPKQALSDWRARCSNYVKHLAWQREVFKTVTTPGEGINIFNYLKKKWESIYQSYLGVLASFPKDPSQEEDKMCIEQEEILARASEDYDNSIFQMTRRIKTLKR